jgi:ribosome-associated translation inhibitor RaiA
MSLNAFSQNDIDSTKIQLTKPIAKLVIKDLVQYDGVFKELITVQDILKETNNKLNTQAELVTNLKAQVLNYQSIINNKDDQMEQARLASESLQKALKKEKRAKKLYQIGSAVGAGAILLLLVQ